MKSNVCLAACMLLFVLIAFLWPQRTFSPVSVIQLNSTQQPLPLSASDTLTEIGDEITRSALASTPWPPRSAEQEKLNAAAGKDKIDLFSSSICRNITRGLPDKAYTNYSRYRQFHINKNVVCVAPDGYFFHNAHEAVFFQAQRSRPTEPRDYTLPRATYFPMNATFYETIGHALRTRRVLFHASLGVINAAWYNYHMFHCLFDALLPLHTLEVEHAAFEQAPKSMLWASNFLYNRRDLGEVRDPFRITLELLSRLSVDRNVVTIRYPGSIDGDKYHCYCGAVPTHSIQYTQRSELFLNPAVIASGRQAARLQIDRLLAAYGLEPHGVAPRAANVSVFQQYRFYTNVGANASQPRLLLILRRKDRRIFPEPFEAVATSLGFAVQRIFLEDYTVAKQILAARYADVLVAVHGAGATVQMFMDAAGMNQHCRTWVELVPWALRWKLPVMMQQSVLSNLSYTAVEAVRIIFDSDVPPALQRKALKQKHRPLSGAFEYLKLPHTLVYPRRDVRRALQFALSRWEKCGTWAEELYE